MAAYPKIADWRIKNFRNLGDVYIDFTESPIVTLLGDNEAGKTSVVKTFGVLGCNAYTTEQKGYIRTGMEGFGISCLLEDGTRVVRLKKTDSNYYNISKPNEPPIQISKIDRGYGVPVEVEKIMGFVVEPETKEMLQVRTYEDQLLFVLTKASENYKVMYNALKVENISRAIRAGNDEANESRKTIGYCEASIDTLSESIRRIKVVDIDNAKVIRERIRLGYNQLIKLDKLTELVKRQKSIESQLGSLAELSKAPCIPEVVSYRLNRVGKLLDNVKKIQKEEEVYSGVSNINEISTSEIYKLRRALGLKEQRDVLSIKSNIYKELSKTGNIQLNVIDQLSRVIDKKARLEEITVKEKIYNNLGESISIDLVQAINKAKTVMELITSNKLIESTVDEENRQAESYYDSIKQFGVIVVECPKCGEPVIVDRDVVKTA